MSENTTDNKDSKAKAKVSETVELPLVTVRNKTTRQVGVLKSDGSGIFFAPKETLFFKLEDISVDFEKLKKLDVLEY